ncbi:hypothetical protein HDG32_005874 [Paraburkholderia sp. CI2]|nr:hypothetical protein [Paraburkholderia sp. CI2]
MTVEQSINQVKIARTAAARAHGEPPCRCSIGTGRKSGTLLMTCVHPADRAESAQAKRQSIQTVARHAPDALDPCGLERFCQIFSDRLLCHGQLLTEKGMPAPAKPGCGQP